MLRQSTSPSRFWHRFLLRLWRDVPFPDWLRLRFLRVLNPSFMVGVSALIQDDTGRVLLLEHTYRRDFSWGLPGGWLKNVESLELGLAREVFEETGFNVAVESLLAAHVFGGTQLDLIYRCRILGGTYQANDETSAARWVPPPELPALLPNQHVLLVRAGVL